MKKGLLFIIALLTLFTIDANAQNSWQMAVLENGKSTPVIKEYFAKYSEDETDEKGLDYLRIYVGYNGQAVPEPQCLQYGYLIDNKKILMYDFKNKIETVAFDFTLSVGDHFTTVNGMEWEVLAARDTIVNRSLDCNDKEGDETLRLLEVRTLDGKMTDQWLEDFGSFANHFMINSLDNVQYSHTLWMEYSYGCYIAREINDGVFFGHDSGWLTANHDIEIDSLPQPVCSYENGKVTIKSFEWGLDHREYDCYYRDGDNINNLSSQELNPQIDCEPGFIAVVHTFCGLPEPECGMYYVHSKNRVYTTSINNIHAAPKASNGLYDLQGRRLSSEPNKGIYIRDGKKIVSIKN